MITKFKIFESNNIDEILTNIKYHRYDKIETHLKDNPETIDELNDGGFYEYSVFRKADLKTFKILRKYGFKINDKQLLTVAILMSMANKKDIDSDINKMKDILFYLIDLDLKWLKMAGENEYFIDYLSKDIKDKIKEKYPKKYKQYLLDKDLDKFNI